MRIISYQELNALLANEEIGAAEAHGIAAAMLSGNQETTASQWLAELFDRKNQQPLPHHDELTDWFQQIRDDLTSDSFEFNLFLPDDEELLSIRLVALKHWCQGFLYGLGRTYQHAKDSTQANEIIKDLTEFTKLDTDAEDEEDEIAYAEITEYLRSAVLVLKDELSSID